MGLVFCRSTVNSKKYTVERTVLFVYRNPGALEKGESTFARVAVVAPHFGLDRVRSRWVTWCQWQIGTSMMLVPICHWLLAAWTQLIYHLCGCPADPTAHSNDSCCCSGGPSVIELSKPAFFPCFPCSVSIACRGKRRTWLLHPVCHTNTNSSSSPSEQQLIVQLPFCLNV